MISQLIFLYFAAVIVVSAVLMVTRKNPIHSVMFMLLLFFHIAGVFVLLNAEFLAAVQLIVYAGAILILYLFVVMLLSVDRETKAARANRFWPWLIGFGFIIATEIALLVLRGSFPGERGHTVKAAGVGVKVNLLFGGDGGKISLQPLQFEGNVGIGANVGVTRLTLTPGQ